VGCLCADRRGLGLHISYVESRARVVVDLAASPRAERPRCRCRWSWRRSGRSWAGTNTPGSGFGSASIWAGRVARSMRTGVVWWSFCWSASARASIRWGGQSWSDRRVRQGVANSSEPARAEHCGVGLGLGPGERDAAAAAGRGAVVLRLPDRGGRARVQPGRSRPIHPGPALWRCTVSSTGRANGQAALDSYRRRVVAAAGGVSP
jgi:hypothetical protein